MKPPLLLLKLDTDFLLWAFGSESTLVNTISAINYWYAHHGDKLNLDTNEVIFSNLDAMQKIYKAERELEYDE